MKDYYIGLDTATVMGFAFLRTDNNWAFCHVINGNPIEQLKELRSYLSTPAGLKETSSIVLEKQHNFRNAISSRSLLERYGYLKYSLINEGWDVQEQSPKVVRKKLGFRTIDAKKDLFMMMTHYVKRMPAFTTDQSDALAVALGQAIDDGYHFNWETLQIYGD